jgi:hypothetical protein
MGRAEQWLSTSIRAIAPDLEYTAAPPGAGWSANGAASPGNGRAISWNTRGRCTGVGSCAASPVSACSPPLSSAPFSRASTVHRLPSRSRVNEKFPQPARCLSYCGPTMRFTCRRRRGLSGTFVRRGARKARPGFGEYQVVPASGAGNVRPAARLLRRRPQGGGRGTERTFRSPPRYQ